MTTSINASRREFLAGSLFGVSALAIGCHSEVAAQASKSAGEKLNIGIIGTANRARANIGGVRHENIAAICDVDAKLLDKMQADFPQSTKFTDFRKLLERRDLDAVVVSTADHTHAPAAFWAMQQGKHVYCEKPLTHTVGEARLLAETAKKQKVATQMGNQIHAEKNYRRVVEILRSGAIGKIKEVHTWVGKGWGGGERPKETPPVPETLAWDLWLGPAPQRAYHPTYLPANWRRWWDFGGGTLADMACHHMDLPFWAYELTAPTKIKAEGPQVHPETCPLGLKVIYTFAAAGNRPEFTLTWYDGDMKPKTIEGIETGGGGNLFIGEKGKLRADYGSWKLYPEADFADYKPPAESIPNSTGHYIEWITACKTGSPTTCNFGYGGNLTESVLLGNIAYRTGKEIEWDAATLKAKNAPGADRLIHKDYRPGWALS
ncbi:MAG: Gfo/Idh/MocA family oxidoreductase [Pirellulales bacterium]